jgi:hypothetical protein
VTVRNQAVKGQKMEFYTVRKESSIASNPVVSSYKATVWGNSLRAHLRRHNRLRNRRNHRNHHPTPQTQTCLVVDGSFFFVEVAVVVRI